MNNNYQMGSSKDQCNQIQQMLGQTQIHSQSHGSTNAAAADHTSPHPGSSTSSNNTAGTITALSAHTTKGDWIVDSGAINHMTPHNEILTHKHQLPLSKLKKVHLPNGDTTTVTYVGVYNMNATDLIHNVFFVPTFKYNLLSVSKLTRDLQCSVSFFPDFFVLQDLYNGQVKVIGKESNRLYLLPTHDSSRGVLNSIHSAQLSTILDKSSSPEFQIALLHKRLGHTSSRVLSHLLPISSMLCGKVIHKCTICPLVKQHRLTFPTSESRSVIPFQLLHIDVWGPSGYLPMMAIGSL